MLRASVGRPAARETSIMPTPTPKGSGTLQKRRQKHCSLLLSVTCPLRWRESPRTPPRDEEIQAIQRCWEREKQFYSWTSPLGREFSPQWSALNTCPKKQLNRTHTQLQKKRSWIWEERISGNTGGFWEEREQGRHNVNTVFIYEILKKINLI